MSSTFNVRLATNKQLVEFYNATAKGNPIVKFRDRATAERRCQVLVMEMLAEQNSAIQEVCKTTDDFDKVTEKQHAEHRCEGARKMRPWQLAKRIIGDAVSDGITDRKELIKLCLDAGIKYNTADGAHYEMCVKLDK